MDIYGSFRQTMEQVMECLLRQIENNCQAETGKLYEHLSFRIKSDESIREKLKSKGLEETTDNALRKITDSVGVRVVCLFIDDVYECVRRIRSLPRCTVITEKDYIWNAKPNGYRSYHVNYS